MEQSTVCMARHCGLTPNTVGRSAAKHFFSNGDEHHCGRRCVVAAILAPSANVLQLVKASTRILHNPEHLFQFT